MRVLVVGSGGREHALCRAIKRSPLCQDVFCAPGNAGIAEDAVLVPISAEAIEDLVIWSCQHSIDFVVVGPETPLVLGLVDRLQRAGIRAFGPTKRAAALEGSKGFMKDLLQNAGIPTGWHRRFTNSAAAHLFVKQQGAPLVIKADGLAAGKGVFVCHTLDEATRAITDLMDYERFGHAGSEVIIEEFLEGEEVSFFALCDGQTALPLVSVQDHKAAGDGDTGPNTGGMGAYSPAPVFTDDLCQRIMDDVVRPTLDRMQALGRPYHGILFCGLMLTKDGPKVLEYNVRFGDPECQVLLERLDSDLLALLLATVNGRLSEVDISWNNQTALIVVMAARGYPGPYQKGSIIRGLERVASYQNISVYHAGTSCSDGHFVASAGRVLGITACGTNATDAQRTAYAAVDCLDWPEGFCRRDIGWRAVTRENIPAHTETCA